MSDREVGGAQNRRIDGFVPRTKRREQQSPPSSGAPTWALVALGVLLVVGLGFVVAAGHPALYGFVVAMVAAGVLERMLDARTPSWGEGHVVAEVESEGVLFRAHRGTVALSVGFLAALLVAAVCFVVTMTAPGLDLPVWFAAFALVLVAGLVYAVRLIGRAVRVVDLRLDSEGVSAVRGADARATVPWASLVAAAPAPPAIMLGTTGGAVEWPVDRLRADPVVVADVIDRCAALGSPDRAAIEAVIDDLLAPGPR